MNQTTGSIYFIQAGEKGPIKIGFTLDIKGRLSAAQVHNPTKLILLHTRPGSFTDEQRLHIQFRDHNVRGEWFKPHPSILEFINDPQAVIKGEISERKIIASLKRKVIGDKYMLEEIEDGEFVLYERGEKVAMIYCSREIANLIDRCLNQTSRAGSKTSQAKRDAAKKNIAKRWNKNEHYAPHIDAPLDEE